MKPISLTTCIMAAVALAGCSSEKKADQQETDASPASGIEITAAATKEITQEATRAGRGSASIRIGDDTFDLDQVFCIPGMYDTAIASDKAQRDGYPTLTIKTYSGALGGEASSSASAMIVENGEREHWTFKSGNIASKDGVFTANGFLDGARMVEQPNGNLKPEPYGDEGVKPFMSKIECR